MPISRFPSSVIVLVLSFFAALHGATSARDSDVQVPGYTFPYLTERCPSERCPVGRWLACEATPIRERPGTTQKVVGQIGRGGFFEVNDGALLTLQPGEVKVTRAVRQGANLYEAGDTLFVLGHFGEGWFDAVHKGKPVRVDSFWPWRFAGGGEISGELVREEVTEFWLKTSVDAKPGWVLNTRHYRSLLKDDEVTLVPPSWRVVLPDGSVGPLVCPTRGRSLFVSPGG